MVSSSCEIILVFPFPKTSVLFFQHTYMHALSTPGPAGVIRFTQLMRWNQYSCVFSLQPFSCQWV